MSETVSELLQDARVQHISAVSSTLLHHSKLCLPKLLQQDPAACQCLTSFLEGKGILGCYHELPFFA
jgi:hypothetical protein